MKLNNTKKKTNRNTPQKIKYICLPQNSMFSILLPPLTSQFLDRRNKKNRNYWRSNTNETEQNVMVGYLEKRIGKVPERRKRIIFLLLLLRFVLLAYILSSTMSLLTLRFCIPSTFQWETLSTFTANCLISLFSSHATSFKYIKSWTK